MQRDIAYHHADLTHCSPGCIHTVCIRVLAEYALQNNYGLKYYLVPIIVCVRVCGSPIYCLDLSRTLQRSQIWVHIVHTVVFPIHSPVHAVDFYRALRSTRLSLLIVDFHGISRAHLCFPL